MDDQLLLLVAGAVGALVGTVITAISNLILAVINRRSEERKQLNELMIKAGIEQHRMDVEAVAPQGQAVLVPPLKDYILANFLLVSALSGRCYRTGALEKRLLRMEDDHERLMKALRIYYPDGTPFNPNA